MDINWQNIFYITASFVMIIVIIVSIWLMRLLYVVTKLIEKLAKSVDRWENVVEDVKQFGNGIKSKVLKFLLKVLNKGTKKEAVTY